MRNKKIIKTARIRVTLVTVISLLLFGCSIVPNALKVEDSTQLVSYQNALKSSQASVNQNQFTGQYARWGGVISEIKNLADQTMLELVYFKSYSSTKPKVGDDSLGRFRVYVNQFLEPSIYKKGRLVSVLGKLSDAETGKIGEHEIRYPVIRDAKFYLWPVEKERQEFNHWRDPYWPYSSNWYWARYHRLHPYYIPKTKVKVKKKK